MVATARHPKASWAWRTWSPPGRLDQLLLAGVNPDASHALRRRSRKLGRGRRRERLARGLVGAVKSAQARRTPFTAAVPVQRAEVRANRALLLELACRIRTGDGARTAGLILARRLLTDGTGPLFVQEPPGALRSDAVTEAIVALVGLLG